MWQLIRLTFRRWCRQEQHIVERLSQAEGCQNISAQVHDHNLIIHNAAVRAEPSAVGRQREIDDPICETKSGGILVENEGSVRGVADRNCHLFSFPSLNRIDDIADFPKSLGHASAIAGVVHSVLWMKARLRPAPRRSAPGSFSWRPYRVFGHIRRDLFTQNHDVRKRPDNQPLRLSAAGSGTRAALRASRFALRRCRPAFSACFRRSVCRDIRAPVSGIVSREESYAQG